MAQEYLPAPSNIRLADLMKEHNISQPELAKELGCSKSTINRFISGAKGTLTHEQVLKIARLFNVSTDFLLGETNIPDRKNYDIAELGLSASSPKKNRLKSFVVDAAISSSWRWDKIMSSCPPLLRRTTCLLRGKEMTPFRESELCNGCLRPQPFWMWRGICIESGRFERLHRCPTR